MKATLNSFIDNNDKIKKYIAVCRQKRIEVLSPDVNKSGRNFEVDNSKEQPSIRFGLKGIKSLGAKSELIIAEREANGEFTSYQDFVKRMIGIPKFDKAAVEALIYAGALDEFEGTRKNKLESLETLEKRYKSEAVLTRNGQMTIFALAQEMGDEELIESLNELNQITFVDNDEFPALQKLDKEKEYTGFYITAHPVDAYKDLFRGEGAMDIVDLSQDESEETQDVIVEGEETESADVAVTTKDDEYREVTVAGIIRDVEVRYTKKDKSKMKTFVIEDDTDAIKCVIFPKKLEVEANDALTEEKQIVLLTGTLVKDESFGLQILVNTIKGVKTLTAKAKKCTVLISKDDTLCEKLSALSVNPGGNTIKFIIKSGSTETPCGTGYLPSNVEVLEEVQKIVGENKIEVV